MFSFFLEGCLGVDMSGMGEMIRKHPVCSAVMGIKPDYQFMRNHLEQGLDSYR